MSAPAPPTSYAAPTMPIQDPYAVAPNNGHFIEEKIQYAQGYDGYAQGAGAQAPAVQF